MVGAAALYVRGGLLIPHSRSMRYSFSPARRDPHQRRGARGELPRRSYCRTRGLAAQGGIAGNEELEKAIRGCDAAAIGPSDPAGARKG
jgi:hypothetical protein